MNGLFIFAGSLAVLLFMEASSYPGSSAQAVLVSPVSGAPLSAEQVDRRTRKLSDGTLEVEEVNGRVYRDSVGRVRAESELAAETTSGRPSTVVLLDPVTGAKVILMVEEKIALRWAVPKFGEEAFASIGGVGEALPAGNCKVKTEKLGKRVIEGLELEGTRITHTCEGQPAPVRVEDRWYSRDLNLIALAVASGPSGTHTARLHKLVHENPDAGLFLIPPEYNVQDLDLSEDKHQ